eukprot:scaffold5605_cov128-Cylindrotheca_fusiformis.AAC.17
MFLKIIETQRRDSSKKVGKKTAENKGGLAKPKVTKLPPLEVAKPGETPEESVGGAEPDESVVRQAKVDDKSSACVQEAPASTEGSKSKVKGATREGQGSEKEEPPHNDGSLSYDMESGRVADNLSSKHKGNPEFNRIHLGVLESSSRARPLQEPRDRPPKKLFWIIGACAILLFIAIAAGVGAAVGIAVVNNDDDSHDSNRDVPIEAQDPTQSPDPASALPTMFPTASPIMTRLETFGEIVLPDTCLQSLDQTSPQYRALEWISREDPKELEAVRSIELLERYSLAVFYFSTEGEVWKSKDRWLTEVSHCMWRYLVCDFEDRVIALSMESNLVNGTIPTEIGNLRALESLNLHDNRAIGTIPSELNRLANLTSLSVAGNLLTGTIPIEESLSNLHELWLEGNALSSTIPSELGSLSSLRVLALSENKLTGILPSELGLLTALTAIWLSGNQLSGSIPSQLDHLSNMVEAYFHDNGFTSGLETLLCQYNLEFFYADCLGSPPEVTCAYCCGTGKFATCERAETLSPTSSPTGIRQILLANILLPDTPLPIPTDSSEYAALQWITVADPKRIPAEDTRELRERFALGLLYFSTNGQTWTFNAGWMFGLDHCSWEYVLCAGGSIVELDLTSRNLYGPLPSQLSYLVNLQRLYMGNNAITGTIPLELGLLTNLKSLQLWSNRLIGSIPSELGRLAGLLSIALSQNQLTGSIPSELGSMSSIEFFQLYDNVLESSIPTEIGLLNSIKDIGLKSNRLTGAIPTEFGQLTQATNVQFWDNELSGTLPTEIGLLTKVSSLGVSSNRLAGQIPSELGKMSLLTVLSLFGNAFTGSIPSELNLLVNLDGAYFHNTDVTSGLESLFCGSNVSDFWADCRPDEIICDCCSEYSSLCLLLCFNSGFNSDRICDINCFTATCCLTSGIGCLNVEENK